MPDLLALEARFDARLPVDRLRGPAPPALIHAACEWSDAVWQAARRAGPSTLAPAEIEIGIALAHRPVFICGAHRSGTTLVRDLLDGHPALSVLPAEGTYYTNLAPALSKYPSGDRLAVMASEWVRRLANPINRPPYWLLGRSASDGSLYVEFARGLAGWWYELERRFGATRPSWPLAAVAIAYARTTGQLLDVALSRWVEKTPANERFFAQLQQEFPSAVIVHVLRHPFAVLASRKQLEVDATGRFGQLQSALDDLEVSFRVAHARAAATSGYCRVRYEDLLDDPARETARIALAIGVSWTPSLLVPTVAGLPASTNTADGTRVERGVLIPSSDRTALLTDRERSHITAALGDVAQSLGYDLAAVPALRRPLRGNRP